MTEAAFADMIRLVAPYARFVNHQNQLRVIDLCTKLFGRDFMQISTFNDVRNRRVSGRWTWTPANKEVMVCFVSADDADTFDRNMM